MAKIIIVAGARPNFIKIALFMEEIKKYSRLKPILIHTGQHYDFEMSKIFFDGLDIPLPDYNLDIGSGLHGWQTAAIMQKLEPIFVKEAPDFVVVVGDVNSTLAAALVAAKMKIKIAHVEAGPRVYDKNMPEEINRVLTDHVSDLLFCPTKSSVDRLKKENIKKGVCNTGDIMYDIFLKGLKIAQKKSDILLKLNLISREYYLATVHRAENTDDRNNLKEIVDALCDIGNVVFPCHPRTIKYLKKYGLLARLEKNIKVIKPLGYLDMIWLAKNAKKIITDSGGLQKEAYWMRVPCVTFFASAAWPEIVRDGWDILVKPEKQAIISAVRKHQVCKPARHYFGDGNAAKKMLQLINKNLN